MISFNPTEEEVEFTNIAYKIAQNIHDKARETESDVTELEKIVSQIKEIGFDKMEEGEIYGGMNLPMLSQVQINAALAYGDLGTVQSVPGLADSASLFRVIDEKAMNDQIISSIKEKNRTVSFIDNTSLEHNELTLTSNNAAYILHGETNPVRLANRATNIVVATVDEADEMVILWLDEQFNEWSTTQGAYYLGLQEAHLARLSFEQQSVLHTQVIAAGDEAERLLKKMKTRMYVLQAAKQQGVMQAAVDYATEHTATRKAFGKTIATFQGVSFRVSQMVIETNVVKNLVLQAASAVDNKEDNANALALLAMNRAHRGIKYVTDSAVQLLGGHGFVQDYPVEKWMRDAQAQVLLYGNEQLHLYERGEQLITRLKTEVHV